MAAQASAKAPVRCSGIGRGLPDDGALMALPSFNANSSRTPPLPPRAFFAAVGSACDLRGSRRLLTWIGTSAASPGLGRRRPGIQGAVKSTNECEGRAVIPRAARRRPTELMVGAAPRTVISEAKFVLGRKAFFLAADAD